jgi:hypothetical protein
MPWGLDDIDLSVHYLVIQRPFFVSYSHKRPMNMSNLYVYTLILSVWVIDPCRNNSYSQIKLGMIATWHMMEKKRVTLKSEVLYTYVE